ncbi:MAG TPA: hypothetical protein VFN00_06125, partial [Arthrobacter sp.]|nr:hypothetical protein [Arthrobacter sp.]
MHVAASPSPLRRLLGRILFALAACAAWLALSAATAHADEPSGTHAVASHLETTIGFMIQLPMTDEALESAPTAQASPAASDPAAAPAPAPAPTTQPAAQPAASPAPGMSPSAAPTTAPAPGQQPDPSASPAPVASPPPADPAPP